jgi:peptidyl-prolyl cis-trans isomerase C
LVDELVQRELLVQDAVKNNLDKSPEVLARLDEAKKSILTQAAVQNFMKTSPVTDAEVKAEYDSKVGGTNGTEYKARHILVKTEAEAKKIIAELDKGGDFAKLANKNSLDAKESQNGGDLGWFTPSQMVEPFSKAVVALEKGKYTKAPVQTQFGWHVILREDSRPQTAPPLEAVKDQLMPMLQRKKIQDMLDNLRKQAKVEILIPLKDEAPKPAAEAPKPEVEGVVVEEEIKDKNGKTVAKEVIVEEEVVEEKAPDAGKATDAKPAEKATEPKKK